MRFQQEEVDSAWCSPASDRAGWGGILAFGCPPGRLGAGQDAISLTKQRNLAQCSETNRSGTHEGSDLACLSKPGEGMIRGDDGEQVSFRKSALHGADFRSLSSGQRVSYRIQEGWLGKEAVEVRPLPMERIAGVGWSKVPTER